MKRVIVVLIQAIAFSMPALADKVTLKNGDKISGKVLTYAEGICLFDANYGGLMKLPFEQIIGTMFALLACTAITWRRFYGYFSIKCGKFYLWRGESER